LRTNSTFGSTAGLAPPYRVLLAIGLGAELIRQCHELIEAGGQAWHVLPIRLDLALLLHTADALYERMEHRAARVSRRRTPRR
jgi:hypothetical protein